MASNVTVELESPYKKVSIKTTPLMLLKSIVSQACEKMGLPDPDSYTIKLKKAPLDLSLSVRFANLAPGTKLTLVRTTGLDRGNGSVLIALQLEDAPRLTGTFPVTTSLWDILTSFEKQQPGLNITRRTGVPTGSKTGIAKSLQQMTSKPVYMIPVCVFMNKEYGSISELKQTTLKGAGLEYGNGIIRCLFRFSDKPIESFLSEMEATVPSAEVSVQTTTRTTTEAPTPTRNGSEPPRPLPGPVPTVPAQSTAEAKGTPSITTPIVAQTSIVNTDSRPPSASSSANVPPSDEPPVFERNIRFFKPPPENAPIRNIVLPDSFFSLSTTEMKLLLASHTSQLKKMEDAPLMTKAMRDREEHLKRQKHPKTRIRVRFPDHTTMEATFYSGEPVQALFTAVQEVLVERKGSEHEFVLYVTPPHRNLPRDGGHTFWDEKLAPASLVYFNWLDGQIRGPFVKVPVDAMADFPVPEEQPLPTEDVSMQDAHPESRQEDEAEEEAVRQRLQQQPKASSSSSLGSGQGNGGEKKLPKWFKGFSSK